MLDLILEPLGFDFSVRSLAASALVGLICAVVGSYVVLKGLAFVGDALSHAAFPGVVAAFLLKGPYYVGAGIAAVGAAIAITWVTRRGGLRADTSIGVVFAGTFALGVFLYSTIQGYVADLFAVLFGNILGIGTDDLIGLAILSSIVLLTVGLLWKELLYSTFDPLGAAAAGIPVGRLEYVFLAIVALTIVVSLQAVGIILVVAMLVTPAATAQLMTVRFGRLMAIAIAIGIGSGVVGLYLSFWLDAASGATIVLVQSALFVVTLLLRPRDRRRSAEPSTA